MADNRSQRPKAPFQFDPRCVYINPARSRVRKVDFDLFPKDLFCSQLMYQSEETVIFVSQDPSHGRGPGAHVHMQDQFFLTLEGELRLELGNELHTLKPGSMSFMPAGVTHLHWNEGDVYEYHLEILAPGFRFLDPPAVMVDESVVWEPGGAVAHIPDVSQWEGDDLKSFYYSDPSGLKNSAFPASQSAMISASHQEPGSRHESASEMHVHKFDQHFYVTQGILHLEMGTDICEVGPHMLAIIPAGVPHRHWAVGSTPEAHITLNVPPPLFPYPEPKNTLDETWL